MKQTGRSNRIFANFFLLFFLLLSLHAFVSPIVVQGQSTGTCSDNIDNDGDGRADWDGVPEKNLPPDPACINEKSTEAPDDVAKGSLIPCTNKCDLGSVFVFLNTLITFLIKVILFPIVILMFVYAGYKYITAQGNPGKKADIKKMVGHIILGMVIILTSWLVVKSVLVIIGYDHTLYFFE